jgi:hypothetical protein
MGRCRSFITRRCAFAFFQDCEQRVSGPFVSGALTEDIVQGDDEPGEWNSSLAVKIWGEFAKTRQSLRPQHDYTHFRWQHLQKFRVISILSQFLGLSRRRLIGHPDHSLRVPNLHTDGAVNLFILSDHRCEGELLLDAFQRLAPELSSYILATT